MHKADMYGHEIYLLGETGYGVSVTFAQQDDSPKWPLFTFFHISDNFQQCLFMLDIFRLEMPVVSNVFQDRIYELLQKRPHG